MKKRILFLMLFSTFLTAQTIYLQDDFEDGNMDGWVDNSGESWTVSSDNAITGNYSLKHLSSDTADQAHIRTALNNLDVTTGTTSWKFNLKNSGFIPDADNKFWVYLMVDDTSDVNGYAVGVELCEDTDTLSLCKLTDSSPTGRVIRTAFSWGSSEEIGIEVTRDKYGIWELKYDTDGGFDNLQTVGIAADTTYKTANYFGVTYFFQPQNAGALWLDDVLVQSSDRVYAKTKVFLEGPFDVDSMKTDLRVNHQLPSTQPYGNAPWNYHGNEITQYLAEDMVDWVLVQLRTGTDSSSTVATRAAILRKDGQIVDMEGTFPVSFSGIAAGNYYVVIRHRNHLAVMSANLLPLSINTENYDFSTSANQAYGSDAQLELTSGIYGLYAGDANANGQIQNDDKNNYWKAEVGQAGYKASDFNLNGQVQNDDKNNYWKNNVGKGTQVSF